MAKNKAKELAFKLYWKHEARVKRTNCQKFLDSQAKYYDEHPKEVDKLLGADNKANWLELSKSVFTQTNVVGPDRPTQLEMPLPVCGRIPKRTFTVRDEKSPTGTSRVPLPHATVGDVVDDYEMEVDEHERTGEYLKEYGKWVADLKRACKGKLNTRMADLTDIPVPVSAK